MPYSDNLYSMSDDGSSDEDYGDHLSPSDGYFASSSSSSNVVPNIPNRMVIDPTLQQRSETDAESKAREADEERPLNNQRYQDPTFPPELDPSRAFRYSQQAANASLHHVPRHHPSVTYSPSSASPTSSRAFAFRTRTPSFYSDAPPAYTPSPATPLSPTRNISGSSTQSRNYSTFASNMGVSDVENERLLSAHPESMGQPHDEELGSPVWSRRVKRRLPAWMTWRVALATLILLLVSFGLLANSFRIVKVDDGKKSIRPAQPVVQDPQPVEGTPTDPGDPNQMVPVGPFEPTFCQGTQHRFLDQVLALDFDKSRNVTFLEDSFSHPGLSVNVGGQVNVRRLNDGGDPRMVLEIVTNDPEIVLDVLADEDLQAMKVSVPKKYESSVADQWPCIEMKATIWVPADAEIGTLSIGVIHLDILTLDDLSVHVADYSTISSVTGDILAGAKEPANYENRGFVTSNIPDYTFVPAKAGYVLDSRVLEVTTTSGHIDGNWPLYDMLGLHTTSGNIRVSITPNAELASDPKPAVLSLSSISGAVHATEPVHALAQIPLRDYLVDIKSTSGGIHGAFAFGKGIDLRSTASDIALDLLPVMNKARVSPSDPAQMETATTSGTTAIRVLEPIWFDSDAAHETATPPTEGMADTELLAESIARPFACLQALHKSTSGDIGLRYPQSWEGALHAETTSGRLSVKGKDVQVLKSTGGGAGNKMDAMKGPNKQGSTVQVHALMGTLDAIIGDEK
ncbi:hypothetical protein F5Y15DRAFT_178533 [Xylariaceae sp. FL0016]|nr:hypothetical protein F5Y15DRAFT_178533 [Xylariaceae sp. FL0016]